MGNNGPTAKELERAISYHGRWTEPRYYGNWAIGPTFAVRLQEAKEGREAATEDRAKLKEYLSAEALTDVTVDKSKHGRKGLKTNCNFRCVRSEHRPPDVEVSYNLVNLLKKRGATVYKAHELDAGKVVLYGYEVVEDEQELVGFVACKRIGETCDTEAEE